MTLYQPTTALTSMQKKSLVCLCASADESIRVVVYHECSTTVYIRNAMFMASDPSLIVLVPTVKPLLIDSPYLGHMDKFECKLPYGSKFFQVCKPGLMRFYLNPML